MIRLLKKVAKLPVTIGPVECARRGDGSEVVAEVDGSPVWFRARGAELRCSPEAFASAVLVAAMRHQRPIRIVEPVDAEWLKNVTELMRVFSSWWSELKPVAIEAQVTETKERPSQAVALCFSGGVDSFHTLLTRSGEIDTLVFVVGYDLRLAQRQSITDFVGKLDDIAGPLGCAAVVMETNLRDHPVQSGVKWTQSHGGALAAVGHLLSGTGRLQISASLPYMYNKPWGSHYDADDLWSSSSMRVNHVGAGLWREQKLVEIMDKPVVRDSLRVCWQKDAGGHNCCRCEKCIRTMLILKRHGALEGFKAFPQAHLLNRFIRELEPLESMYMQLYRDFSEDRALTEYRPELERLLSRSLRQPLFQGVGRRGEVEADMTSPAPPESRPSKAEAWDDATLRTRIDSGAPRPLRHAAGSPDAREVEAYVAAIPPHSEMKAAVVLGMTPELRNMAARKFERIYSVDVNPASIALYRDWLDESLGPKETVIKANWMDCGGELPGPVDAVFGDGVFANLEDVPSHLKLLRQLKSLLKPGGAIITRKALMTDAYRHQLDSWEGFLSRYRAGEISDEEFGFGMRVQGFRKEYHDPDTATLECGKIFAFLQQKHREGEITDREKEILWRYYFNGDNCIVTSARWHSIVAEAGFDHRIFPCEGKDWYRYYRVYRLMAVDAS